MEHKNTAKILTTLKKARSHLDKIIDMIEQDEYCIDVIQQLNAVEGYISSAKRKKLEDHMHSCFVDGMEEDKGQREKYVEEILRILKMTK